MRKLSFTLALVAGGVVVSLGNNSSFATSVSLTPMSSFGGGDGWIAPGERAYLTSSGDNQRGLAFNPATGHVLVANRAGGLSINVLDGTTGGNLGAMNLGTVFNDPFAIAPLNMIAAGDDGAIFVCNLANTNTAAFRIYRWQNEADSPQGVYASAPINGARFGDTLDARGVGESGLRGGTQLLTGIAKSPNVPGNNGYVMFSTDGGAPYSMHTMTFSSTAVDAGDHGLGITFLDSDHAMGTQGGYKDAPTNTMRRPARVSDCTGFTPTLLGSPTLTSAGERPMDFATIAGVDLLATLDTDTSMVRIYDMTNMTAPQLLGSLSNILGPSNANSQAVGQIRWGAIDGDSAALYALNTNNGIQAFTVTVPEPACMIGVAGLAATMRRRPRKLIIG